MADYDYFEVNPNCNKGNVDLKSNLFSIQGETRKKTLYNDGLDLTNDYLIWNSDYIDIKANFLLRIWMKPSRIDEDFCYLGDKSTGNYFKLHWAREYVEADNKSKDCFVLQGYENNVLKVQQKSNYVNLINNLTRLMIWVKKKENNYELILTAFEYTPTLFQWIENGGVSNVEYNKSSTIDYEFSSIDLDNTVKFIGEMNDDINITPLNYVELTNGVYQYWDLTDDVNLPFSLDKPNWTNNTVMNCNFKDNINAGNIDYNIDEIERIEMTKKYINKKAKNSYLVYGKNVTEERDIEFETYDNFISNNSIINYSLLLYIKNKETVLIEQKEVNIVFNSCFISDRYNIFKLYSAVEYSSNSQNIPISIQQPIGKKYPIVIKNAKTNYESGQISFLVLGENFEVTKKVNRADVVAQKEEIIEFLTNGLTKFYTDWNGNTKIIYIGGSPTFSYNSSYGNGVLSITFDYVEQGDWTNQEDYYTSGLMVRSA
jgi:hypothetical protein|uniref:Uncharacterized protein n=1 Tax=Phage sp. ctGns7 TaxID=2828003 RepID=A0A8S5S939_9VIRU|nr:MAG TPA: hypothetical protein [Phage sp. ctGns7]